MQAPNGPARPSFADNQEDAARAYGTADARELFGEHASLSFFPGEGGRAALGGGGGLQVAA